MQLSLRHGQRLFSILVLLGVGCGAFNTSAYGVREHSNPFAGASRSALVLVVPLDAHARSLVRSTLPAIKRWLPSDQLLSIAPMPGVGVDASRGEVDYSQLGQALLTEFQQAQGTRPVLVMAVSSNAVFDSSSPQLSFVFGGYVWQGQQYAAVFGTRPMRVYQPQLEKTRLTKFMLRYIGEIVCGLSPSSDPTSVTYSPIMGTPDLDRMVPTLPSSCHH